MNRRAAGILVLLLVALGAFFVWRFRGALPALLPPTGDIAREIRRQDESPLTLPEGFRIEVFTGGVPGARVLAGPDALGNFWVSQTSEGVVSNIEVDGKGGAVNVTPVFRGLNRPHGLVLDPKNRTTLYIAETDKISRALLYTDAPVEGVAELPGGGRHFTRTIAFGPDPSDPSGQGERLYVSIGSSCDTCEEGNPFRAKIISMSPDGSLVREFARGLRNAVFFDWDPMSGQMWATDMGRDFLGDDLPPDEVNIVREGEHYGWPFCYGKQVRDSTFGAGRVPENFCDNTLGSHVDIPAHSAPLGLAFIPEEGWPEEFALDLLVAYHGSWNRSEPTGYKVVRVDLDQRTRESRGISDFITGWLTDKWSVLGRPVDLLALPGGVLFVTDDKAGVIYRVTYQGD